MPQNLKFCISISFTCKFEIKLRMNVQIKVLICLTEVGELNLSCFSTMKSYPITRKFILVDIKEY